MTLGAEAMTVATTEEGLAGSPSAALSSPDMEPTSSLEVKLGHDIGITSVSPSEPSPLSIEIKSSSEDAGASFCSSLDTNPSSSVLSSQLPSASSEVDSADGQDPPQTASQPVSAGQATPGEASSLVETPDTLNKPLTSSPLSETAAAHCQSLPVALCALADVEAVPPQAQMESVASLDSESDSEASSLGLPPVAVASRPVEALPVDGVAEALPATSIIKKEDLDNLDMDMAELPNRPKLKKGWYKKSFWDWPLGGDGVATAEESRRSFRVTLDFGYVHRPTNIRKCENYKTSCASWTMGLSPVLQPGAAPAPSQAHWRMEIEVLRDLHMILINAQREIFRNSKGRTMKNIRKVYRIPEDFDMLTLRSDITETGAIVFEVQRDKNPPPPLTRSVTIHV